MPENGTQKKKGSAGTNKMKTNGKSFAAERINPGNRDQQESKREKMLEYSEHVPGIPQKTREKSAVKQINNVPANAKTGPMAVEGRVKFNRDKMVAYGNIKRKMVLKEKVPSNAKPTVTKMANKRGLQKAVKKTA